MQMLEIEYLSYICKMSLTVSNQLSDLYHQYSDSYNHNDSLSYSICDNELNDFLLKLIDASDCWPDAEKSNRKDYLVINYYRLEDLVRYMHNVDYLVNKHSKELAEKTFNHPKLRDLQLGDSRLSALTVNNQNHTCSITLNNVLLYNEKRINRNIPVDCGTIVLFFKDIKNVEMKGKINSAIVEANKIYNWCITETVDKQLNFEILTLANNRQYELQVNFSDIEVISLTSDCNDLSHW